jgi:A/G-specific adenine glycosylase
LREGQENAASDALLDWYDVHARVMPWRVGPRDRAGVLPDPYRVWLSEVMLQQTTVASARDYFLRFTARWPRITDLAAAQDQAVMGEWAGLGYYARARNLLACARAVVRDHGGVMPQTVKGLLSLPGVGPYTAAAVAAIAYDLPAVVVDGNVDRVVSRLWAIEQPLPLSKPLIQTFAARLTPQRRPGDHAQAMMDLGATICSPRNPACGICPVRNHCEAQIQGLAASLPRKLAKPEKPTRQGQVWLAVRACDGAVLIETRPPKGLLGGMPGFPGDAWDGATGTAPLPGPWRHLGEVRHTFTHFHLSLSVHLTEADGNPLRGEWRQGFDPASLPTLMRKAYDLGAMTLPGSDDTLTA